MSIEDRLVEDQDFYVRVQKTKLVLAIVLGFLAWALHGFPGL
jgi:hypothetical protein